MEMKVTILRELVLNYCSNFFKYLAQMLQLQSNHKKKDMYQSRVFQQQKAICQKMQVLWDL